MTVPDEVMTAAMAGVARHIGIAEGYRGVVRAALEAAAPVIARAERERIRDLATELDAICAQRDGWPFADLLQEPPVDP